MRGCEQQASGIVELYFYGELDPPASASVERHMAGCAECRQTLGDLSMIRTALSSRARVEAPRDGDWSAFMSRLNAAITSEGREVARHASVDTPNVRGLHYASYLATAALLTLVASGLVYVGRQAVRSDPPASLTVRQVPVSARPTAQPEPVSTSGFAALSEQHFERSKLVVLGLASKDAKVVRGEDWAYERGLASNLLDDTRLYRMAAEERGLATLAGVMGDLELVLMQTSLTDSPDGATLDRIQRLIEKRDLVTKMDVTVTGS
jgi:hypothetical protein